MIAYYNEQGRYLWTGSATLPALGAPPPPEHPLHSSCKIHLGLVDAQTQYHDTALDGPVDMPQKPSEHHAFDYTLKRWVADTTAAWDSVKQQRSRLLADSDWVVTKATESGLPAPAEWSAYRQALRDITLQADPWAIVWPVAP